MRVVHDSEFVMAMAMAMGGWAFEFGIGPPEFKPGGLGSVHLFGNCLTGKIAFQIGFKSF